LVLAGDIADGGRRRRRGLSPVAGRAVAARTVWCAVTGSRSKEEKRLRRFGSRWRRCRWWLASTAWPLADGGACGGGAGSVCADGKKRRMRVEKIN